MNRKFTPIRIEPKISNSGLGTLIYGESSLIRISEDGFGDQRSNPTFGRNAFMADFIRVYSRPFAVEPTSAATPPRSEIEDLR